MMFEWSPRAAYIMAGVSLRSWGLGVVMQGDPSRLQIEIALGPFYFMAEKYL